MRTAHAALAAAPIGMNSVSKVVPRSLEALLMNTATWEDDECYDDRTNIGSRIFRFSRSAFLCCERSLPALHFHVSPCIVVRGDADVAGCSPRALACPFLRVEARRLPRVGLGV